MRSTALLSGITLQPGTLRAVLLDRLTRSLGKDPDSATQRDIYDALSLAVREELATLRKDIGTVDRRTVDQYATEVREIERRLQIAAQASSDWPGTS